MHFQGFDWLILAAMVYEPLYHAQEKASIKLSSGCPYPPTTTTTIR